jgi:hypothetical protein
MAAQHNVYTNPKFLVISATSLTLFVCILAFINWGQAYNWEFAHLSPYQIFPIFGVLAFSIMWSQYIMEAIKNYLDHANALGKYFSYTSLLVVIAILLHPGLLIAQRFKDGYGLPPGSYVSYVAPSQKWIVLLGSVSLMVFLAFEFKRLFGAKSWWKYVILFNDVAIVAIFYHGLQLGHTLQNNWFRGVWYFYGLALAFALAYKYYLKVSASRQRSLQS